MNDFKTALKFLRKANVNTTYTIYKNVQSFSGTTKHWCGAVSTAQEALSFLKYLEEKYPPVTMMDGGHSFSVKAKFETQLEGFAWSPSKTHLHKLIDKGY